MGIVPQSGKMECGCFVPVLAYLLKGPVITRPNQVWSADITSVRLAGVSCIWWRSSTGTAVTFLAWNVSATLDSAFCLKALDKAIRLHSRPEILNSDQGCQCTST